MPKKVDLGKDELEKLYFDEGLSQREIAERKNCSQAFVSKRMKKWELNSRHEGFWTDEEISWLWSTESPSPRDLARLSRVTGSTTSRISRMFSGRESEET
ncbi:MAG: hypothetical protein ABEJ99_04765 [Candidatus Nanohaloarchaea archaeon]